MRIEETDPSTSAAAQARGAEGAAALRTDARRNLRHVLSAARDVFGEHGYEAPIEEVARRARVGVGTVYRRFPNKEALVQYIAEEEVQRLTDEALAALTGGGEPWPALAGFVRCTAAAGTSRLLPELFEASAGGASGCAANGWVPQQRTAAPRWEADGELCGADSGRHGEDCDGQDGARDGARGEDGVPRCVAVPIQALLAALSQLVGRAREAGQLRPDVTVADVLLVIATTPPRLTDATRQAMVSDRLLDILLQGLRPARQ